MLKPHNTLKRALLTTLTTKLKVAHFYLEHGVIAGNGKFLLYGY